MSSESWNNYGNSASSLRRELTELLTKQLHCELSSEEKDHLQSLVTSSESARELYVQIGFETAVLVRYAGFWRNKHRLEVELSSVPGQADLNNDVFVNGKANTDLREPKTCLPPESHRAKSCQVDKHRNGIVTHRLSNDRSMRRLSRRFVNPGLAIVGCIWIFLAYVIFFSRTEYSGGQRGPVTLTAATLISEKDCVWQRDLPGQLPRAGYQFKPGESVILQSGVAELAFADGAVVAIQGRTHLELRATNKGFLHSGALAAHVPSQAIGFEIETPTSRIVDLGTDFRLAVESIETRCAVVTGKTDLFALNVAAGGSKRIIGSSRRLSAGQAVAVAALENGTTAVRETKFDPTWLSEIAPRSSSDRLSSPVVAYQSSDSAAGNENKFHGGLGLDFEVRVPLRLHSLGVFDHLGDGIDAVSSPVVELWSRDMNGTPGNTSDDIGGKVLATQTFRSGDAGLLKLGHRFKQLPKPIELPVGSYSIVAYGLFDKNSFVMCDNANSGVDFSVDPGWVGVNNNKFGNNFGWKKSTNPITKKSGEVGGTFARNRRESSYGDIALSRMFTLNDSISASGSFHVSDSATMDGIFFIGHYLASTADDRREFIGAEFKEGEADHMHVRARLYRGNGDLASGSMSSWISLAPDKNYHFEYEYDPTYEADERHPGPEGKITLHVYSDGFLFDQLVTAVLEGDHRSSNATFDAFGMGMTAEAVMDDDPNMTSQGFLNNANYSGLQVNMPGRNGATVSRGPVTQIRVETTLGAIEPTGSRFGKCEPGMFPKTTDGNQIGYSAGSFEYSPQKQGAK